MEGDGRPASSNAGPRNSNGGGCSQRMPATGASRRTISYDNGTNYVGEFKDGNNPHGTGTFTYSNGSVYEGEVKDGKRHGRGVGRFNNGAVYDGDWKGDKYHGHGTLTSTAGDVYDGEWKDGMKQGKGVMRHASGVVYDGEWKDGLPHGNGSFVNLNDKQQYAGEWKAGKKHGKGRQWGEEGNVYEGEFADGWRDGWGKMTWAAGGVYEGEWRKGKPHGKGTMKYLASGDVYEGDWVDGMPKSKGGVESETTAPGASAEMQPGREKRVYNHERTLRSAGSQQRRLQKNVSAKECEHCGADDHQYKLRVCSGCNLALYCSAACQKAASRSHRRICDIISELPPRDADRIVLVFDKDEMVDLDAGLRYATKYMDNLKHLEINLDEMGKDDAIKLSPKRLYSLFRSREFGELESVACSSSGVIKVGFTQNGNAVWTEIYGLKQLRLEYMRLGDVQNAFDAICQQRDTLEVLCLPCTDISWSKAKSRRTIAQAVGACKQLVKLDLAECVLMDSDLKVMLGDLPNLRILHLRRHYTKDNHEFTDNTCGLIARKCPGLQELNLYNHDHLSVRGIRRIFEGCPHLRSFYTSTRKLSCKDMRSLLDIAPQLVCLSLGNRIDAVTDQVVSDIIESTGGRTVFQLRDYTVFEPDRVSAITREKYEHQKHLLFGIWSRREDPGVANEWAGV